MASRAAILRAARAGSPGAGQPTYPPQGGSPWIGQLPSYGSEPGPGYSYSYGPFLPRPSGTFSDGAFGPFPPILPVPVDTPPPGVPRAQPRRFQYRVGWNLPVGEPGTEGVKLASFQSLQALAETYSILRTCLERRKNEVRALDWDITLTTDAAKAYQGDRQAMRSFHERRKIAKNFFRRPDPNYYTFEAFTHAMMDQVFVIDALALYQCPKRGAGLGRGLFGSDLDCLWLLDGATIRPLLDLHGATPRPPAPGYEQYIYGVPRSDLTMMAEGLDLAEAGLSDSDVRAHLRSDQLIYHPYLQRPQTVYGFGLVEQALIPIMTGLRKQAMQLNYFDESSVPRVWLSPGDNTLTPNQLRELQDAVNAIAGDLSWAFKVMVVPPNSKVIPQKDMEIVDQADEWIATEVCMVCDITPMEIGILPKISTVASPFAAREMAQANKAIRERTATKPTLAYVQSVFNFILQQVCGQEDLQFTFEGMQEVQDQAALTDMLVKQVQSGIKSIDEARDELHMTPWDLPETRTPVVFTQMGPVPLDQAIADTQAQIRQAVTGSTGDPQSQRAVESLGARASATGQGGGRKALPAGTSGQGRMNGPVTQRQARRGGALAPAHATGEGAPGHSGGRPGVMSRLASKAVLAELEALERHLRKGMPAAEWVPQHIPGSVMSVITEDLDKGLSAGYVIKAATTAVQSQQQQQTAAQQRAQQAQLAATFQAQISAAFAAALTAAQGLIAAWWTGTLAVTAAVLASMIAEEIRTALLEALTGLWTAAWQDGATAAGGTTDVNDLDAFLAAYGEHWAALISGTGQDDLMAAIRAALAAGDPLAIITALEGLLTDDRAAAIAQNEVMRAWNAAFMLVLQAAGIAYKRWITSGLPNTCAACLANQAQGSIPVSQPFKSGKMGPLEHVNCRCHLGAGTPPKTQVGKVLRREVGLNGQETWTEWEAEPGSTGGRVFQPHLSDGREVPQGGVPGASAGGAPPRWDGSEPDPVTEHAPDPDYGDDAGIGPRPDLGARPGTYWPAPYMDGWWPSPHGHGSTQPGTSSPGAANGRPPNGVGKTARVSGKLKGRPVAAAVVYRQLLANFPKSVLGWVLNATWRVCDVPAEMADTADEDSWAASHQPEHVQSFVKRYERGEKVNLPVMVDEPGHLHLVIADGRHRFLARRKMGKETVRAYVGTVPRRGGPWLRIYQRQKHGGNDPRNKSFTAGNLGLPGNVSGLTPLTVEGQRQGPYCAGLAVRAADTGRVLMIQRAITDSDPAAGLFEWPGGHAETGESLLAAAAREWAEEVGHELPVGPITGHWASSNGIYECFVLTVPHETDVPLGSPRTVTNPDGDAHEPPVWWDPELVNGNPAVRPELRADYARFMAALDSQADKSARTPMLEVTPRILGPHGLWHTPSKKVPIKQKLPDYVEQVAGALMDQQGMGESQAIATAINAIKRWAAGDLHWGHGKVTPEVIEASKRALAEWEQLRASHAG